MSASPVPSALDVHTQAFPILTPPQIARVKGSSKLRRVEPGEVLFAPGDTSVPFFVLLSGAMEIVQPDLTGEYPIAKHGPGEFTGEMTMISGQRCLVLGRVTEPGEFLELTGEGLRSLIARDAELSEIFMRAFILRRLELIRQGRSSVILMGSRYSAKTLQLREFLTRNGFPYSYVDLDLDRTSQDLLDRFEIKPEEVPVVICSNRGVMRNPSIQKLADCLGFNAQIDDSLIRDVIIVGAGPSGLAAAVYAASEGLDVLVIETESPGGQAGSSSKIENYLGFPTGVSGQELATRAITQAEKFGAKMMIARNVVRLDCAKRPYKVVLDDGRSSDGPSGNHRHRRAVQQAEHCQSAAVRRPGNLLWCDLHGVATVRKRRCRRDRRRKFRRPSGRSFSPRPHARFTCWCVPVELSDTMSRYLIQRIEQNPAIEVHYKTEIVGLEGDTHLERITWQDKTTGETSVHDIRHVFIMAGASPRTDWLQDCVALDSKGFILTGRDIITESDRAALSVAPPQMLETSLPGVFAVGDVRSGNVKRVASAVGEGAIAVHMVHRALAEL